MSRTYDCNKSHVIEDYETFLILNLINVRIMSH